MIRPLTCLSLVAALGAGLYLYQEKHRAQLLDRDITRTVKQAEQARDRIGLLKAEWALLNEPDRLSGLAAQHLQLQTLAPMQFARLEDLRGRLPAVMAAPVTPAVMDEPPAAAVTPPRMPANAPVPAGPASTPAAVPLPAPVMPTAATAKPGAAPPVQLAGLHPPRLPPHPAPVAAKPEPEQRPLFAPVLHAYAPVPVAHAPTVQTASALAPAAPYVGSALGMGRTVLAAPVPVGAAGYPGR